MSRVSLHLPFYRICPFDSRGRIELLMEHSHSLASTDPVCLENSYI